MSNISPYDMLRTAAEKHPAAAALKMGSRKFSYKELLKKTDDAVRSLAGAGVSYGDTVTFLCENTPEYVFAFFAASRIGAACNLLRPETNQKQLKKNILETKTKVILVPDMQIEKIQAILEQTCLQTVAVVNPTLSLPIWSKLAHNYTKHPPAVPKDIRYIKWPKLARFAKDAKNTESWYEDICVITYDITNPDAPIPLPLSNRELTSLTGEKDSAPKDLHTGGGIKDLMRSICLGGCCTLK